MSKLEGHKEITNQAIREIGVACKYHPIGSNLDATDILGSVIARDIEDAIFLGHWANYGQKHHFMRRFDGQSPFEAYTECVSWIKSNTLDAAKQLFFRMQGVKELKNAHNQPDSSKQSCHLPGMIPSSGAHFQGRKVLGGDTTDGHKEPVMWRHLGNAVHAIQDSFSVGHVMRNKSASEMHPGTIIHIKKYVGAEKENHSRYDKLWQSRDKKFTIQGRQAINATKEIILMIIKTAQHGLAHQNLSSLHNWEAYQNQWLAASPKLNKQRDFDIDIIERFHTGFHIGANNIKTFNFDEKGLAEALYREVGTDTSKLYKVFARLKEHYSSDADDVTVYYVDLVRKNEGTVKSAICSDKKLIDLLIRIADEGFTTEVEKKNIEFLKSL